MSKNRDLASEMQSRIDNTKEAKNSTSGYKHTVSSGTQGVGDILKE